jgi:hypothetical protein
MRLIIRSLAFPEFVRWVTTVITEGRTAMAEQRDRWRARMDELIAKVVGWVEPKDWVTRRYPKRMRDADGTVFEVPSLFVQKGPTRLLLDPIAYDAPGSEGVVDLYLMPTYDDTASLDFVDGRWQIHYVFHEQPADAGNGQPEVMELSETTINRILDEIACHAVPSV